MTYNELKNAALIAAMPIAAAKVDELTETDIKYLYPTFYKRGGYTKEQLTAYIAYQYAYAVAEEFGRSLRD